MDWEEIFKEKMVRGQELAQGYFRLLDEQRQWTKRSPWPKKRELVEAETALRRWMNE